MVGSRGKAFKPGKRDKKLFRFYLPLQPANPDDAVWSVIRTLADKFGEQLTTFLRAIADENALLKGILDRVDFNATTHGVRDIDDSIDYDSGFEAMQTFFATVQNKIRC